jgi:hypothetical protein
MDAQRASLQILLARRAKKACAPADGVSELQSLEQSDIFNLATDGQNLDRQQNSGTEFDGPCFAAIFALLARGLRA